MVARSLGIPSSYAFDYEFARVQHGLGCRAARRVVVPEAIPQDRLDRLGARAPKVRRYPGLKEEYYLHGFAPDPRVLDELGARSRARARRRADPARRLALPPAGEPAIRRRRSSGSGATPRCRPSSCREQPSSAPRSPSAALPSLLVPEHAIDAQSLVALSDLVVSAGGTMNREAVALGVPVYTTFAGRARRGRQGLVEQGRLRVLTSADELEPAKRTTAGTPTDARSGAPARPDALRARAVTPP